MPALDKGSSKEAAFALMWDDLGGPALERQYRFHPVRRWRADFAHLESKTLIEIDGGVWVRGRHVRPDGFARDCVKTNTATLDGWAVFRLTPDMITPGLLRSIVEFCRHRND